MNERFSGNLSWLIDFRRLFGAEVDLVLEPRSANPDAAQFDYGEHLPKARSILLQEGRGAPKKWISELTSILHSTDWQVCLANLIAVPPRSLQIQIKGEPFVDGAAFLAEALESVPSGKVVVALSATTLLVSEQASLFRAWLATAHRVEGIVYMGHPAAELLGTDSRFSFALAIIRSGIAESDTQSGLRLVNLRESPCADWVRIISEVTERGGGEVGPSIVLRNPHLDERPWTYERFSKAYDTTREDTKQLGTLRPLSGFAAQITVGLDRTKEAKLIVQLDDSGAAPEGAVPCFGGRSIGKGGTLLSPVCAILCRGVPEDVMLRPGDVLLRSIVDVRTKGPLTLAAIVTEERLPATFDRSCIRIRWRPEVRPDVTDLLASYLNSVHVRHWLIANGVQITLSVANVKRLEVPDPSDELLAALETLAEAERQYRTWANEVAETRRGLFVAKSFAEQLPVLFGRHNMETDRLRVARDAERLEYRVRNYFPHPIALRRELILQLDPGKSKIEAVLDCAEHLITWLAVMAIAQEPYGRGPVQTTLHSFCRHGALHLDWGKCVSLIQAGATFTLKHPSPLALSFPELAEIAVQMADQSSGWVLAERHLREWRNKQAHLQRLPESDLKALSDQFVQRLDCLLDAASFIGTLPLVYVVDYELNPVTFDRVAVFHLLQGISPVFPRVQQNVGGELPRGAVGFLTQRGEFVSALPWLTMNACPVCKRPELFVFNRYARNEATYVAMESGHPHENQQLAKTVATLIGESGRS
jgi:hypothetical protein